MCSSDLGASLTVKADPLVSWSYRDAAALASPIAGEPIDADKAITLATQMLAGIGVDTSKIDWQVDRFEGLTRVTGWQLIDDARTQLSWVLGFDPDANVLEASGFSAGLEQIPAYDVVGAATAVKRVDQPQWAGLGPRRLPGQEGQPTAPPSSAPSAPLPASADQQIGRAHV